MASALNWLDFLAIGSYFCLILLIGYAHSIKTLALYIRRTLGQGGSPEVEARGREEVEIELDDVSQIVSQREPDRDIGEEEGEGGGERIMETGGEGEDMAEGADTGAQDYFLSGRDMTWWAVGASLFASNIGSEHFIGLAGSGAAEGIPVSAFEWSASVLLILLAYFFAPLYLRSRVFTTPEWIRHRYSPALQQLLAVLSLLIYLFTKISVTLFAGGVVLQQVLGWNMWVSSVVLVVATGTYTVAGGLRAVIYTEVLQTVVLMTGGIMVALTGLYAVGGLATLHQSLPADYFHLLKPANHPDYPWTGVLFGVVVNSTWYWCCDQVIVQRALSAKSEAHAKTGCVTAGFLKLLTPLLMVLPGMISRVLYPEEVKADSNIAYTLLVTRLLPHGLMGLCIASILAALMSSLASVFNSSSTIFTMDLYKGFRPSASQKELVAVGRCSAIVMVVAGILWIPFIGASSDQLFLYTQSVSSYLQPPITAIFVFGALWPKTTTPGAAGALLVGSGIGMARLVLELVVDQEVLDSDELLSLFVGMNYLHFALLLFFVSSAVLIVISMCTQPGRVDKSQYTWSLSQCVSERGGGADGEVDSKHFLSPLAQKVLSAALVGVVAFLYILLR